MSAVKIKIQDAMIKLLETYSFNDITVTQLSQEAEVARTTYYRSYDNKRDIILDISDNLMVSLIEQINQLVISKQFDMKKFVEVYFKFWEQHEDVLDVFIANNLERLLIDALETQSYQYFSNDLWSLFGMDDNNNSSQHFIVYVFGGLNSMLFRWYEDGKAQTVEQLVESVMQFIIYLN